MICDMIPNPLDTLCLIMLLFSKTLYPVIHAVLEICPADLTFDCLLYITCPLGKIYNRMTIELPFYLFWITAHYYIHQHGVICIQSKLVYQITEQTFKNKAEHRD